jgi:hypothetical protein
LDGPRLTAAKRFLLAQAAGLGHVMTHDPDLRVWVGGRELVPEIMGSIWRVDLPEGTETIRLASRAWTPAYTRAEERDTRSLGVAIDRLWLDRREASLDSSALGVGWHAPEPRWRWTNGDAGLSSLTGVRALAFRLAISGSYWKEPGVRAERAPSPPVTIEQPRRHRSPTTHA